MEIYGFSTSTWIRIFSRVREFLSFALYVGTSNGTFLDDDRKYHVQFTEWARN